jgi:hypothetical protein
MSRPVRDKTKTEKLNYAFMGGKNPITPAVAAPKKRVFDRWTWEDVDADGGSPSFPSAASTATQPPPIGPFLPDYYEGVAKVKKVKYNDIGGKHTVFASDDDEWNRFCREAFPYKKHFSFK